MASNAFKHVNLESESVRQLLRAAQEQWTRHGFHGASLREIAEAAGVSKSLVHYHFESKEHLLLELQADWSRRSVAAIRARVADATPSLRTALAAVEQVWDAIVAARTNYPFAIELWRQSVSNAAVRARLRENDQQMSAIFCEVITATLGPHVEQLALPVPRAAALIRTILDGLAVRLFHEKDVVVARAVFDDAKLLLIPALLPGMRGSHGP